MIVLLFSGDFGCVFLLPLSLVATLCKREYFIKIKIMLTIKQIRENKAFTLERLAVKGVDAKETVDRIEALDDERKSLQGEMDA